MHGILPRLFDCDPLLAPVAPERGRTPVPAQVSHSLLVQLEWAARPHGPRDAPAHATPQGDLFEYLPADQWGERVRELDCDVVILGHTHIPGVRRFGKLTVVNPGSVGLARDCGGEACYAVYDGSDVELRRVPYDVCRTIGDLRAAPLSESVISGMEVVLRPGERAKDSCGQEPIIKLDLIPRSA